MPQNNSGIAHVNLNNSTNATVVGSVVGSINHYNKRKESFNSDLTLFKKERTGKLIN